MTAGLLLVVVPLTWSKVCLCASCSGVRMSLQWTAVATFLYAEVFFVLLLCIPFISPKRSVHTCLPYTPVWITHVKCYYFTAGVSVC